MTVPTEEQIRELMVENLAWNGSWSEVTPDYPLLVNEVVDSFGILKLISLIEAEFGVTIENEEIVPDNWKTIRDIAALVESKRS